MPLRCFFTLDFLYWLKLICWLAWNPPQLTNRLRPVRLSVLRAQCFERFPPSQPAWRSETHTLGCKSLLTVWPTLIYWPTLICWPMLFFPGGPTNPHTFMRNSPFLAEGFIQKNKLFSQNLIESPSASLLMTIHLGNNFELKWAFQARDNFY